MTLLDEPLLDAADDATDPFDPEGDDEDDDADAWSSPMLACPEGDSACESEVVCIDQSDDACGCNVEAPPAPLALWALDEAAGVTASERVGRAPQGTLLNFDGEPWTLGQVDGALSFDGVDDHVQVGAAGSDVRSLAFWAKPESGAVITNATGTMFPSTAGPNNDWSSPEKAFSEGGGNATANLTLLGSKNQHWGGFHIPAQLPADADVVGITVSLKSSSFGVIQGLNIDLSWDGGSSHTDAGYGGVALLGSNNVSSYGGADKLWGRTWQAQDFSDPNFRVRVRLGGLLNLSASVDFVSVQIHYADYAHPRNILSVSTDAKVEFVDAQMRIAATGWPGAITYVNGVPGATLDDDWNFVVVTGGQAIDANLVQLGNVTAEVPNFPFHGLLDDVALFAESLTAEEVGLLYEKPTCGR